MLGCQPKTLNLFFFSSLPSTSLQIRRKKMRKNEDHKEKNREGKKKRDEVRVLNDG